MSIERPNSLYVSYDVRKALRLLAKSGKFDIISGITGCKVSADQIADDWLRERIKKEYPQVFTHQKEVEKLEKTLIESLTK